MNNDFFAACRVTFEYDDGEKYEERLEYIVFTNVATHSDAVRKAEEYYGEDLIGITVTLFEGPALQISKELYDKIEETGGELI